MSDTIDLDAPVAIALAKSLAKLTADLALQPGVYPISETITLKIAGSVKRAPDGEYHPAAEVPLVELLACALEHAGCDRKRARWAIEAALPDVAAGYSPRNADRIRDAEIAIDAYKAERKGTAPVKIRAGAVTAQVVVEVVRAGRRAA